MGNQYHKPERKGNSPFTRSGVPPPPILMKAGSDAPVHRINDAMSLELHMADERVRAAGLTPAEREWRIKWLKDQKLHPDEPIHVDAVYRQLNPIRRLYRWPLDKLYLRFLRPTFDWEHYKGIEWLSYKQAFDRKKEIEEKYPGLLELGIADPAKDRYFSPSWDKRTTHLEVGETQRPW